MSEKRRKQIQAGLLIATVIVWCAFGYMFLEGTWKEELEEQRNMTKWQYAEFDWGNTTMPYFNDSVAGTNEEAEQGK
jgi:hypothetical protein